LSASPARRPPEGRAVAGEGEPPAERVHGGDHAVGKADDDELPPRERAQRLEDGLGADAVDEHREQDRAGEEEQPLDESHDRGRGRRS